MKEQLTVSYIVGEAWEITKKNFLPLLGVSLVLGLIYFAVYAIFNPGGVNPAEIAHMQDLLRNGGNRMEVLLPFYKQIYLHTLLFMPLTLIATSYLLGVGKNLYLTAVDGKSIEISNLLISLRKWLHCYIATILVSLITSIGLCLLVLPGIYLGVRLQFAIYYVVDQDCDAIEAIKRSWEATNDNFWSLLGIDIVLWLIYIGGFLVCCVGILFTLPMILVGLALMYRVVSGTLNNSEELTDQFRKELF